MANTVRLNRAGVAEILKAIDPAVIDGLANEVAAKTRDIIDDDDVDVVVDGYTTDRKAAAITIADPRGLELQATLGALSRAAAAVGLEVRA